MTHVLHMQVFVQMGEKATALMGDENDADDDDKRPGRKYGDGKDLA